MDIIDTAVILTAGNGTRRLPITRVVEKVMLPIGNRPTVDYAVEQCVAAGLKRIVFVTSTEASQVQQYYGDHLTLATEYPWLGLSGEVELMYVPQRSAYGYGSASGVRSARQLVGNAPRFVVVAGDGFVAAEVNPVAALLTGCGTGQAALLGLEVPVADISHYGIITAQNGHMVDFQEKPERLRDDQVPLANVSYYVLPQAVFGLLDGLTQTGGEYYLTDAVLALARETDLAVIAVAGRYLDSGQVDKWLAANQYVLAADYPDETAG